jgi:hypothetical protein
MGGFAVDTIEYVAENVKGLEADTAWAWAERAEKRTAGDWYTVGVVVVVVDGRFCGVNVNEMMMRGKNEPADLGLSCDLRMSNLHLSPLPDLLLPVRLSITLFQSLQRTLGLVVAPTRLRANHHTCSAQPLLLPLNSLLSLLIPIFLPAFLAGL